jgi:hypothetical protein
MSRVVFVCACVAGLLQPAWGQDSTARPGIRVTDPSTALSATAPRVVADESIPAASIVPTTGKLIISFTIKLVTPVPTGGSLSCSVSASVLDQNPTTFQIANEISEEASTKATVSGATATCKVSIPYSWNLTNTAKDSVNLQYVLYMVNSTTAGNFLAARTSSQFVVPGAGAIKVPTNGATSNFTVSATI